MLPNVRLLIAAMLASILVLMCGFGVFAAFRVSHEPIAHLPAAMAPLQLVAENGAAPSAMLVARKTVDQHSQFDATVSAPDETTAPTAGTAEQHDAAEFAAESEPTAAPQPVVASDLEPSDAAEPQKEAAAIKPPEQLPRPPAPANDLRASAQGGGDRSADVAADAASSSSPLRPVEPAATGSAGARETTTNATPASEAATRETVPVGQTTMAEALPTQTAAVPNAEEHAVASLAVEAMRDDAADRSESDTLREPPLPRARPTARDAKHDSYAQHVRHAQPAHAANERPQSAAVRPRRTRVVVRSVRAVRFTAPYYAQAQYAQSIDQSYGYGQSNFQGAAFGQEQIVVRRVVRPTPARLAARKANSAMGGPFVRAPSP
jgi:hypothetical protein